MGVIKTVGNIAIVRHVIDLLSDRIAAHAKLLDNNTSASSLAGTSEAPAVSISSHPPSPL
ncbi:hypothetical protein QA644_25010 (plasmid) [Rhizobium sp. CC1099]|uniref:hypothetical protein n=1 Tax=Rhizobium sp. CC1099 TaxID=3039160 RepID=UPI0024B13676|nr:hypothetical protein [Rhizobium sp. CC1099]WFU91420.1 hypothetical protein QA644_25010 [Rhizobium sp. CC1099]